MELHLCGEPSRDPVGSTVFMEETVDQTDEQSHWTEEASSEERLSLKEEVEEEENFSSSLFTLECQDMKPTVLPKMEPTQHQENGRGDQKTKDSSLVMIKKEQGHPEESSSCIHSGEKQQESANVSRSVLKKTWQNQHTLEEDVRNSLVIIKMEPVEQALGSSGNRPIRLEPEVAPNFPAVCKTEPESAYSHGCGKEDNGDLNTSGCNVPSLIPKMEPLPPSIEHQEDIYALNEDVRSSLCVIKMEPDEQELSSSGEHNVLHELDEVSDLPTVCKTDPNPVGMLWECINEEPQHENIVTEEYRDLNMSDEGHQLPGEEHKGLKSYSCSECGRTFSQSSSFYRHMRIHTGERPFQCSQCNKTFIQSNTFKIHQRIHTGEKPYECSDCGKNFRRLDNLRIHQRAHTGEKPYKCSHCPKTFARLDILQNHERIHTGEKPYQCPHCSKTFTRSSVYQVHQRTHTGERPYKCLLCGRQFLDLSNLRNHERTHTKKRLHQYS